MALPNMGHDVEEQNRAEKKSALKPEAFVRHFMLAPEQDPEFEIHRDPQTDDHSPIRHSDIDAELE